MTLDPQDRALLAESVDAALGRATDHASGDGLLAELGWLDMLAAEPADAVAVVFDALGRTNAVATVLDDVVAAALGRPTGSAVILPTWGAATPPAAAGGVHGLTSVRITSSESTLIPAADGTFVVPVEALTVTALAGVDPALGLHAVSGTIADAEFIAHDADVWRAAVSAGRRALGHWLTGTATTVLRLAREHAVERVQFGHPIAGFQAVRHKLADCHVAIEAASGALLAADEQGDPLSIDLARVLAGQAAALACRHGQQILAGIGFTRDHDFHLHLQRTLALDGLFASTATLTAEVGAQLISSGEVPRLVDL